MTQTVTANNAENARCKFVDSYVRYLNNILYGICVGCPIDLNIYKHYIHYKYHASECGVLPYPQQTEYIKSKDLTK